MGKSSRKQNVSLVWLRDDLRVGDNPALAAAMSGDGPVAALYILDQTDDASGARALGAAARWKLHGALQALGDDLARVGAPLLLVRGPAAATLESAIDRLGAKEVFWNRRYEPAAVATDAAIKQSLQARGVAAKSFNGALLVEPWRAQTAAGAPYQTFSPFYKTARRLASDLRPLPRPTRRDAWTPPAGFGDVLDDWALTPRKPDWAGGLRETWSHGEAAAKTRLAAFLKDGLAGYANGRDFPAARNVSALSPYLRFGEISPRQARQAAAERAAAAAGALDADFEAFERELFWRDFSYNLLFHAPDLATRNVQAKFDAFPWRDSEDDLERWRRGRTGYPIVDAGMRQLWRTGWMHNRVRMVVASFLTKHLVIDWRSGERWFWDTLVDADVASNPANWQWVAGSGADAAPYFRIFNPVLQGEKFDSEGAYVREWVPELAGLPDKFLHAPWTAPEPALAAAGVRLGETYPEPMVEHKFARRRALAALDAIKAG